MAQAELDLNVHWQDVWDFQRDNVREIWVPTGMKCPVKACPDHKFYTKFGEYIEHWHYFHAAYIMMHRCNVCKQTFMKKPQARQHLKKYHGRVNPEDREDFTTFQKTNNRLIEPGDVIPPRRGNAKERQEAMQKAREEASRKRKARAKANPVNLMPPSSTACVNRDEEVLFHGTAPATKRKKHTHGDSAQTMIVARDDLEDLVYN